MNFECLSNGKGKYISRAISCYRWSFVCNWRGGARWLKYIKPNKKIIQSKNRQYIGIKSTTSYDKNWINNWKVDSSFGEKIGSLSYDQSNIQSIQIQSKRKHNTKLLPREHSQKLNNGRSVVNIALEQYSNRTKIKTLNDYFIEGNWAA